MMSLAQVENWAVVAALYFIALAALLAVAHPAFDDTLLQRVALSAICIGAIATAHAAADHELPNDTDIMAFAAAVYAGECLRIVRRRWRTRSERDATQSAFHT